MALVAEEAVAAPEAVPAHVVYTHIYIQILIVIGY